jgi:hypothetical protein
MGYRPGYAASAISEVLNFGKHYPITGAGRSIIKKISPYNC